MNKLLQRWYYNNIFYAKRHKFKKVQRISNRQEHLNEYEINTRSHMHNPALKFKTFLPFSSFYGNISFNISKYKCI